MDRWKKPTPHSKQYLALVYFLFLINSPPRPLSLAQVTFRVNFYLSRRERNQTSTWVPFKFSMAFSADSRLDHELQETKLLYELNPSNTFAFSRFSIAKNCDANDEGKAKTPTGQFFRKVRTTWPHRCSYRNMAALIRGQCTGWERSPFVLTWKQKWRRRSGLCLSVDCTQWD